MKQIILGLLACALLSSCNNSSESQTKNDSNQVAADADTTAVSFHPISDTVAQLMIYHFLSSNLVSHSKETEIQRIEFSAATLQSLFGVHHTQRLRLFTAAYLDSDTDSARRNTKTIILQLKDGNRLTYYDIYSFESLNASKPPICPPPSGTCDLNFASTLADVQSSLNN